MKHFLGIGMALIAAASGCAGGAWLESPSEAQLPLDAPARGYPTAIRPAAAAAAPERQAQPAATETTMLDAPPPAAPAIALDNDPPPAAPEKHARVEDPRPLATTLAVVPPQYRRAPPQAVEPAANPLAPMSPTSVIPASWQTPALTLA